MGQLPGAPNATANDVKVRDYLLNPDNQQNGGKARQFTQYGFKRSQWTLLAAALKAHPVDNQVVAVTATVHGVKYVVQCDNTG